MLLLQALYVAYKQVRKNGGAAGIDGQRIDDFTQNLEVELRKLLLELQEKRYQARPVKRVEIAKDDGGIRLLGIPTVRDRIVQQCLTNIMTPIFDPNFHPSSYGYRVGRSCHQAISKATLFIRKYNKQHVVDMDLSKCFDMLDHDLIIKFVRKRIVDGSILGLIRQFLKSGVMIGENWQNSVIGSPLLANIYLDEFDQEMMRRKHRIVRYADDILIFCTSKKGAENALKVASHILEVTLKLKVNERKTHIAHSDTGIKFLGVEIFTNYTAIQEKKLKTLKAKVRQLTKRNGGVNLARVLKQLNPVLRGFVNYFKIANITSTLKSLAAWIRRRLRAVQMSLWKKPCRLHRRLKQLKYKPPFKSIKMNSWRNSASPLASYAMPNQCFKSLGLYSIDEVKTGVLASFY
ncbi:group II intron reverse transcriptase/maturase [Aliivibrio salmonicida LFI1238]|uniref:Group II intron reverse transcriptase/maturase n=2 Tax=Aliivibrio salmonicida TaxID=40269 RepID=B6EHT8_ALISL|nr:group II intron reverse transcriptase/maturase [Aliivibrio salmonicida LFI1238]